MIGLIIIILVAIFIIFLRNQIYNSGSNVGSSLLFIGDVYSIFRFVGFFVFLAIFIIAVLILHKIKGR